MATAKKGTSTSQKKTSTKRVSASSSTKSRSTAKKPSGSSSRSRKKSPAPQKKEPAGLSRAQKMLITGIVLLFITAVVALSVLAPTQGQFTTFISQTLARGFGLARYVVPLATGLAGVYFVLRGMDQQPRVPIYRLLGLILLFFIFVAFASLVAVRRNPALGDVYTAAQAGQGGGYLGAVLSDVSVQLLGNLGTIVTLAVLGIIGAVLVSGITRRDVGGWLERASQPRPASPEADVLPVGERTIRMNPNRGRSAGVTPEPASAQLPLITDEEIRQGRAKSKTSPATTPPTPTRAAPKPAAKPARAHTAPAADSADPLFVGGTQGTPNTAAAPVSDGYTWTLPHIDDMLESGTDLDLNNAAIREQVEVIEQTLESFGAPATVVEINQGPTITQFGVEPNYLVQRGGKRTKVKVGKIAGLADDLALALAARSIRIQAPVPGKGYVGIEVPNTAKALVSLRDVMESPEFGKVKSPLRVGLGQNVAGTPIVADLAAMPHLLIAGTTGSGKSVCVNGLIAGLLLLNTPDDLKLVMVDPKRVELTGYNGIPHLAAPVVVEMDRVVGTLQWAQREMDHRYKLFAEVGARNIGDYNKKISRRVGQAKMPYIVIIVDELADLMMLAPEETERAITRLAQMARATGIHMVIATQRPSVDVVTGLIKANFPARIAFAVASSTDSRVILDTTGAERLLGQGDMLFQSPDAAAAVRLQGCFVSDAELQTLITYWRTARRSQVIAAEAAAVANETAAPEATTRPGTATPAPATAARPEPQPAIAPPITHLAPPTRPKTEPAAGRPATPPPATAARSGPPPSTASEPMPAELDLEPEEAAADPPFEMEPLPSPSATKKPFTASPIQQPLWEALQEMEEDAANGATLDDSDELLPEAIATVRKLNKASTSLLQRRFRIGYTRAARLIDVMEEQGIIGPPTGTSKARDVYGVEEEGADAE
jgi:S-DNA-T family DNA segregation ATPase FtsK/SpoIIIE